MSTRHQLLGWVVAAAAALVLLLGILVREHRNADERWNNFLAGDPQAGAEVFREKGCSNCHAVYGSGAKLAPDLGIQRSPNASMDQLVTEMWNHAPRMWGKISGQKISYPRFSPEEMADLFAFLYATCYADETGNTWRGKELFASKGCIHCHSIGETSGKVGPNLMNLGPVDTPIFWAQEMWNHAPAMEKYAREFNLPWPRFSGREMNDLLAYIREQRGGWQRERVLLPANPERGWTLFRKKGCINCHAVRGEGGTVGPDLGPGRPLPPTMTQVAGQMWNHSPEMWSAMKSKGVERPTFEGRDMADIIAFLYSLRAFELGGSPLIGKQIFSDRHCAQCHSEDGRGGDLGPRLRARGRLYTSLTLAHALWAHGPRMYQKCRELGIEWPTLKPSDLGHLLAFLNSNSSKQP